MNYVQSTLAFFLVGMTMTTAQAAPVCNSGWAYQQFAECPNTAKPIFEADASRVCPGDARCVPESYQSCARAAHGLDTARPEQLQNDLIDSERVPGGRDQVATCQAAVTEWNRVQQSNGVVAEFVRVRPEFEDSKKRHSFTVTYVYTCEIKKARYPFLTKVSEACPVAAYKLKVSDVRERSKNCAVDPKVLRAENFQELRPLMKGIKAATCLSCANVEDKGQQQACLIQNLKSLVYSDVAGQNIATDEDKVKMAETACVLMMAAVTSGGGASIPEEFSKIIDDTKITCK